MKLFRIPVPDPALRICIRSVCRSQIFHPSEILYCCADRNYTRFQLVNGNTCVSSQNLAQVRKKLEHQGFLLINKSCLVNSAHISGFTLNGRSEVMLTNNETLPISRHRKAVLMSFMMQKENR